MTSASPPVGLYLHIPFCVSHCPYCDFVVVAGREARGPANRIEAFVAALEAELGLRADALDQLWAGRAPLETLYLGGGTPSLLPADTIARLIARVRARFGLAEGAEVTLEVNPGADERGDAVAFREAGVTRLSIGAQSMVPGELRTLGRRHSPGDVAEAVRIAREAGFDSISIDLLYDVPGQTPTSWSMSLEAVLALDPDHVSMYALTLDDPEAEGLSGPSGDHLAVSRGARRWRDASRPQQDPDRAAAMYELADRRLARAGFAWYEISNWARPGKQSRHNLGYWQGLPWEAAGPGAHAFDGVARRWNGARLDSYISALAPGSAGTPRLPPGGTEDDDPTTPTSAAVLALRTSGGLPAVALDDPQLGGSLAWAKDHGLLEETAGERLVLTVRGRLLSNEVFVRLI